MTATLFRSGPTIHDLLRDPKRRVGPDFLTYAHIFTERRAHSPHRGWLDALTAGASFAAWQMPFERLLARMPELGEREVEFLADADLRHFFRTKRWMA